MKKIVIDGGDNGYCCACGGLGDRCILEEDTSAKTLKYIDGRGVCLGARCWHDIECADGTRIVGERSYTRHGLRLKLHAERNGEVLPCAVRNNKWGKDGEYGTRGTSYGASRDAESGRVALRDYETEAPTGWTLLTK